MNRLVIHGIYRHYKGNYYIVEAVAKHTETNEELVLYRPLYGNGEPLYARPKTMFLSEIEPAKCQQHPQKYRFELQNIKSAIA